MALRLIQEFDDHFNLEPERGLVRVIRRDSIEPVPIGSFLVKVFRVTGYDRDCDGSLMVRYVEVDRNGKTEYEEVEEADEETHRLLLRDRELVVDSPDELWQLAGQNESPLGRNLGRKPPPDYL